jgi:hypothetical protein
MSSFYSPDMTLLHDAIQEKKLDSRLVEKNLAKGHISPADYEKTLKALPDDSENADYTNLEELVDNDSNN